MDPEKRDREGPGSAIERLKTVPGLGVGDAALTSDLARYPDCLSNILLPLIKKLKPRACTADDWNTELERRFHQDFETMDTRDQPLALLFILQVKRFLKALPGPELGFGLDASAVQNRQRSRRMAGRILITWSASLAFGP
jgi:hypothetical protein